MAETRVVFTNDEAGLALYLVSTMDPEGQSEAVQALIYKVRAAKRDAEAGDGWLRATIQGG